MAQLQADYWVSPKVGRTVACSAGPRASQTVARKAWNLADLLGGQKVVQWVSQTAVTTDVLTVVQSDGAMVERSVGRRVVLTAVRKDSRWAGSKVAPKAEMKVCWMVGRSGVH